MLHDSLRAYKSNSDTLETLRLQSPVALVHCFCFLNQTFTRNSKSANDFAHHNTQSRAVSTNVPLHQAGDGQKDNLAACYLFILLLFWEQLKRSVSFGCPLLQDYSLLNLLAAFSIILSQVSLPSCPLTQRQIEGRRQGEREDGYRQIEALRVPSAWKWPPED